MGGLSDLGTFVLYITTEAALVAQHATQISFNLLPSTLSYSYLAAVECWAVLQALVASAAEAESVFPQPVPLLVALSHRTRCSSRPS